MTDFSLADVVEVVEVRNYRTANPYLAAGYRLLRIDGIAVARPRPDNKEYYVQRVSCFILGRTADVAAYEPTSAVPA